MTICGTYLLEAGIIDSQRSLKISEKVKYKGFSCLYQWIWVPVDLHSGYNRYSGKTFVHLIQFEIQECNCILKYLPLPILFSYSSFNSLLFKFEILPWVVSRDYEISIVQIYFSKYQDLAKFLWFRWK